MTNVGRFSLLSETQTNPSVPVLILCLSGKPWTARDFINLYEDRRIGDKHERFRSVLAPNSSHFVVPDKAPPLPVRDLLSYPLVYRSELKSMITDALLKPMDLSQSLWQAWAGTGGKVGQSGAIPATTATATAEPNSTTVESLLLFRAHHCMADGVSLGAIFGDLMDEGEQFQQMIQQKIKAFRRKKKSWWQRLQIFLYYWWWGSIKAFANALYLHFYSMFLAPSNPWKYLQQQSTAHDNDVGNNDKNDDNEADDDIMVENSKVRTLSWVQVATVDEVKQVADFFTKQHQKLHPGTSPSQRMTVNDIFCSCITGATAKLMKYHRQQQKEQTMATESTLSLPYLNLVMPVHMQGGILFPGQSMGNKIGAMVNQVPAEITRDAAERLHQVHDTLWAGKQTPAAVLSFIIAQAFGGTLGTFLGPRITSWLFSKAHANASIVVTNVRGPETAAHLGGRKVEANLGFLPLPPGVPIGMVVMSYNQRITLTVMAEPWAVPDADRFLAWVVEEYQELLKQAQAETNSSGKR